MHTPKMFNSHKFSDQQQQQRINDQVITGLTGSSRFFHDETTWASA